MPKQIQCQRCAKYMANDKKGAVHIASCRVHNGWSNYESWVVALWLDNDHGSYTYWRETARACAPDDDDVESPTDRRATHVRRLADRLQEEHDDRADERLGATSDVYVDLLRAALSEVCWREVAEHILSD